MKNGRQRHRIGMLTPSSNTVLEPMASAILAGTPHVSVHYSRIPVTEISLGEESLKQFKLEAYLAAAKLLADAKVHVIGWNGTSASWSSFEADKRLCRAIKHTFGVESTTAVLAINQLLKALKVKRIALVTPYVPDVQNRIIEVYREAGYECVSECHFGEQVNYAFAEISDEEVSDAIRKVAAAKPDAIVVMCTNLRAAHLAESLEDELGITVLDSVSAFVWRAVHLCGIGTGSITGWGRLFGVSAAGSSQKDMEDA